MKQSKKSTFKSNKFDLILEIESPKQMILEAISWSNSAMNKKNWIDFALLKINCRSLQKSTVQMTETFRSNQIRFCVAKNNLSYFV